MTTSTLYTVTRSHIDEMLARKTKGTLPRRYFDTDGQKHLRTLRVTARLADKQAAFEEYKANCLCEGWEVKPQRIGRNK